MNNRRSFIQSSLALAAASLLPRPARGNNEEIAGKLRRAMESPVLRRGMLPDPVRIESVDMLKNGVHFVVRVRSKDGGEGFAVANRRLMSSLYPIFVKRVKPHVVGKDARDIEELIRDIYRRDLNYKWQGLPFWVCVAVLEFAVLDLLGNVSGKPVGELLGGVIRTDIGVYQASGNRGNSPQEEMAYLEELIAETGARAVKYRLGGRMMYNEETTRRDRELVPLTRKVLGDSFTIYVDANGSYDVPQAVTIGRMLEDHGINFYEEPCPFDYIEETREVGDALTIPIAGGEQESSMRQFRMLIERKIVDVAQPDPLHFGGLTRAIRVARMAEVAGIPATPHMSGYGLGYLYVLHYASCVPNAGPYQEYKGDDDKIPFTCDTSSLRPEKGIMRVPTGPGLGIRLDRSFIEQSQVIEVI